MHAALQVVRGKLPAMPACFPEAIESLEQERP
jgi:hypothetical protein